MDHTDLRIEFDDELDADEDGPDSTGRLIRPYAITGGRTGADVDIDLEDFGEMGQISTLWRGRGVIFRTVEADYELDFHVAPRRQLVVNLTGAVEIDTGEEARVFEAGSIMLAEDTTGKGHISRNVDGQPRACLFVPLDDGVGERT